MQLTAIVCGFFGTGAKAELYSLSLFHVDGDQVRRYGSLVSTSQTPPARQLEQAGLTREQLEQAPSPEQVWGEVRRYFTHSLVICIANEAAVLSGTLERRGMYPPVMFTLSIRELAKNAGVQLPADIQKPEQLVEAFWQIRRQYRDWETCIGMIKPSLPVHKKRAYTFFDCETADSTGQICSIGLLHQDSDGKMTEYYSLVNPERPMQKENLAIHGITDEMAAQAPTFPEVWKEIRKWFQGSVLVAHSASAADLFFLKSTLACYQLELGEVEYICTCRAAQKLLPRLENHRLNTLCAYYHIPLDHHNALSDAQGCYQLFIELGKLRDMDTFISRYDLSPAHGQRPVRRKSGRGLPSEYYSHPDSLDFTAAFAVTGDFRNGSREEAEDKIRALGGVVRSSVTKSVKYLVVGSLGSDRWVRGYGNKVEKARELGVPIIAENDFWKAVNAAEKAAGQQE